MADIIPFGQYAPDIKSLKSNTSEVIENVVPRADGYGPFFALVAFTLALAAGCRGFFFARNTDNSVTIFAASSTRIYQLNNTNFSWTDVSAGGSGGGGYSALAGTDNWQFAQFNTRVIAVQANVAPQSFILGSSTEFAALAGSPPQARAISIVNRFVVLIGLLSNPFRVQWSDVDDPTGWTAGVGLSDFQDLPDGGVGMAVSGGDQYGIILQEASIRSMIFNPGSPTVFDIVRVSTQDGLFGKYSVINAGDRTFFCSPQGFKKIDPGGYPTPIGKERVDRTFFADVDKSSLQLFQGATDPTSTRVYWAYKSIAGQAGLWDTILSFDWSIGQDGRWTKIRASGEYLAALARPGLTLEALDAVAPGIITISGAANNGSGLIRLTISALTAGTPPSNTDLNIENTVTVYGVVGTTEANATWRFTIIDATHIDLVGSTFSNAYVSGGSIGGSLDQLPFSLDSISTAALAQLAAFSSDHQLGFFDGDALEAILDTPEQDGSDKRLKISGLRPITDAAGAMCSVGCRTLQQETTVTYTTERAIHSRTGICPAKIDTRYARGRLRIPAGEVWESATGLEPIVKTSGKR
jgi:hypothetical protein